MGLLNSLISFALYVGAATFVLWYMAKMMNLLNQAVALHAEANQLLRDLIAATGGKMEQTASAPFRETFRGL